MADISESWPSCARGTIAPMTAPTRHVALAVTIVVNGAGGDWLRNLIGYPAWGVAMVLLLGWTVVEVVRLRPRIGAIPIELAVYVALALLSTVWALSPWSTLGVGGGQLVLTVMAGLALALLPFARLLATLHWTLQSLLAASLLFELVVELLPDDRLFPIVPAPGVEYGPDSHRAYAWSRGLLFQGGRIQGIMGNANLLAMVALLALIIAAARAVDRRSRASIAWIALPLVCLVLTRSSTVLVATAGVAIVTALVLLRWRMRRRAFLTLAWSVGGATVAGIALVLWQWPLVTRLLGRDSDLTGRLDLWARALGLWHDSPVLGTGYMGYWLPWVPPFDHLGVHEGVVYLQAHDVWIDHLMQLGILGIMAWAALQLRAFRSAASWSRIPSAQASVPLLVLTALAVQGLAESRPMIEIGMVLLVTFASGLTRRPLLAARPRQAVAA